MIVSREYLPHHNLKWLQQQVPRGREVPSEGGNSSVNFLGWAQVRGPDSEIDPESVITEPAERNRIEIFKDREKKNGIPQQVPVRTLNEARTICCCGFF